jgi:hypothetical protein
VVVDAISAAHIEGEEAVSSGGEAEFDRRVGGVRGDRFDVALVEVHEGR